ncbi:MAG: DUF1295 domain-containing protein [Verrucomicrobiota bacterium]
MFWWVLLGIGLTAATAAYGFARKLGLMALVDLIWTGGLGLAAAAYYLLEGSDGVRPLLVLAVVGFWSFRLSYHLLKDRVLPGREDPRYANLARRWGARAARNFLGVFWVQVPFVMLFLVPVAAAMRHGGPLQWTDALAVCIAFGALAGEAVADRQLARFRSRPENKGEVCREGLWRYSRHPNYFFEWLHWWAYVAFAWGSPEVWPALAGPVSMYVFLRFITGVPPAEYSSLRSRGEAYRDYQRTTNAFFPWKPHKPDS